MNFTNDELHKLKQILNLFKKTNALDTLIQGSNITLSRNKCGQTVISSSGSGSNLPIEVENALLNANTPSSTNPYATLSDISTTANITDSIDKRFVTDANLTVIGNTSGVNTGDNAINSLYSGLVSNATHTGEVTGATGLTLDKTAITNKTTVTVANDDYILISDTSDSGNLKKALKSDFGGQVDILQIQMFI